MPNGEGHDDQPKSKASRSVKTPLQKEALEAAYSSKTLFQLTSWHQEVITCSCVAMHCNESFMSGLYAEQGVALQSIHSHQRKCERLLERGYSSLRIKCRYKTNPPNAV